MKYYIIVVESGSTSCCVCAFFCCAVEWFRCISFHSMKTAYIHKHADVCVHGNDVFGKFDIVNVQQMPYKSQMYLNGEKIERPGPNDFVP